MTGPRSPRWRFDVSVVTSGHDVADARLHRLAAAFLRAGLTVEVLGLGDPNAGPPGARVVAEPRPGMLGRARLAAAYAGRAGGAVLLALDPDSLLAALAVRAWRGTPVIADVHEDYSALLRDRRWARRVGGLPGRAAALIARVASAGAGRADLTVVVDDHVPPMQAAHRLVVPNLPDPTMLPPVGELDPQPRAIYVGDVRASRGLFSMVEAIAAADSWTLDIVGPVAPDDQDQLDTLLSHPALRARIRLHGRRAPVDAFALARGAWCGLILLDDTPAFRDAMPSKLYEYLACGLPVVATDLPRMRALLESTAAGALVSVSGAGGSAGEVLRQWGNGHGYAQVRRGAVQAAEGMRAATMYGVLASEVADLVRRSRSRLEHH